MRIKRSGDGFQIHVSPEQLGALYALSEAGEDAGLDETTISQDFRVAMIDAGLVSVVAAGGVDVTA